MSEINNINKTILFVAHDRTDRELYHHMLSTADSELCSHFNFHFIEASSASEAIQALEKNPVDCILLNYDLPDMSVIDFSKHVMSHYKHNVPPIIVVTSKSGIKAAAYALHEGITDFLIKDETTPYILCNTVRHCLEEESLKTEIGEQKAQLKEITFHDRLTGLPNRYYFMDILKREMARVERLNQTLGLLVIDIDDFKHINDTLGHPIGDELIKFVAERIKQVIRRSDMLARIDGNTFTVIAPQTIDPMNASRVAEKIMYAMNELFKLKDGIEEIYLTCSIGISNFPLTADSAEDLFRSADAALHESKEKGKNTISYFRKDINDQYVRYVNTVNSLKRAISKKEMYLHYQPKYDVATGELTGAEALLRWERDNHIKISPADFIPVAERSRLMPQIGEWIFDEAIKQASLWRRHHPNLKNFILSINLSPFQLRTSGHDFLSLLTDLLKKYDVPAEMIEIEITETAIMQKITDVQSFVKSLTSLGVKVAIDDFGTGFSSLERLKTLDVNTIKIDKSFIQGIDLNAKDAVIARAAINLAQNLGLRVIAEGVETASQLQFLKDNHCDELQGFIKSGALPPGKIDTLIG